MAELTDDADHDAGETSENVPNLRSDAGNYDTYYGRGLRARCVLLSLTNNNTKMQQRGQPIFINRKDCDHIRGHTILIFISSIKVKSNHPSIT
ncbi:unnamed protein product [Protopolystoma xenopodis]|uniref:Uncharacterized protein n=1 Tax=Protopolystoma xenopodis TaxID=117903 RepID=A0A3S5AWW1_9PLAT|nr:unnamed protein product [Protopolystoma xenopodis]